MFYLAQFQEVLRQWRTAEKQPPDIAAIHLLSLRDECLALLRRAERQIEEGRLRLDPGPLVRLRLQLKPELMPPCPSAELLGAVEDVLRRLDSAVPQGADKRQRVKEAALRVYLRRAANEKLDQIAQIATSAKNVEERLREIDAALPIPPTATSRQLAALLQVSPTAIQKTAWWKERMAERAAARRDRRARLRERAARVDPGELHHA